LISAWQGAQRRPAPQLLTIERRVEAPSLMSFSIVASVTAEHWQRIIASPWGAGVKAPPY
jgi:hypothetical protein